MIKKELKKLRYLLRKYRMEFYIKKEVEEIYEYNDSGVMVLIDEIIKGFFVMKKGEMVPRNKNIHIATIENAERFLADEVMKDQAEMLKDEVKAIDKKTESSTVHPKN